MDALTRNILLGFCLALLAAPMAYAQTSQSGKTRLKRSKLKRVKKAPKSPFSGSFKMTVGRDTNPQDTKFDDAEATFYEISPGIKYQKGMFSSDLTARIKDFNDQQTSNNAKETGATIGFNINTKLFGNTDSTSSLTFDYAEIRYPDYFASDDLVLDGAGMPNRSLSTKIAQSLGWDMKRLNFRLDGSFTKKDYSTRYSDFTREIFGRQEFELDKDIFKGSGRLGIKLRRNLEIAATPSITYTKFEDREARQSNGQRIGDLGDGELTEFVKNEMKAEVKLSAGPLTVNPHVISGINIDQANGGEDYNYNELGISGTVDVYKKNRVKLKAGYSFKTEDYDRYVDGVIGTGAREDEIQVTKVGASFGVTKQIDIALDYSNREEVSNHRSGDFNFRQEIISSGLSLNF